MMVDGERGGFFEEEGEAFANGGGFCTLSVKGVIASREEHANDKNGDYKSHK